MNNLFAYLNTHATKSDTTPSDPKFGQHLQGARLLGTIIKTVMKDDFASFNAQAQLQRIRQTPPKDCTVESKNNLIKVLEAIKLGSLKPSDLDENFQPVFVGRRDTSQERSMF